MRVYLPVLPAEHDLIRSGAARLPIAAGRDAWRVGAEARASVPGDEEDLEYEAMQDAVHVALGAAEAGSRALIVAGDVPDALIGEGDPTTGLYGATAISDAQLKIASLHVTELDASAAAASDTDPALLWFDAQEGAAALDYLAGGEAAAVSAR